MRFQILASVASLACLALVTPASAGPALKDIGDLDYLDSFEDNRERERDDLDDYEEEMLPVPEADFPLEDVDMDRQSPDIRNAISRVLKRRFNREKGIILDAIRRKGKGADDSAKRSLYYARRRTPAEVQDAVLKVLRRQGVKTSSFRPLQKKLRRFLRKISGKRFDSASKSIQRTIRKYGKGAGSRVDRRLRRAIDEVRRDIFNGANQIICSEIQCGGRRRG